MTRHPPRSTLFPHPTLFRSVPATTSTPATVMRNRIPSLPPLLPRMNGNEPDDAVDPRGSHEDRKSTRLNSSHSQISYAVFCLKKKKKSHSHYTSTRQRNTSA